MPGRGVAFNDERAHFRTVAVVVGDKRAVFGRTKCKRQTIEALSRAVPNESVREAHDMRTKLLNPGMTREGVDAVCRNDDVEVGEGRQRVDSLTELDAYAGVFGLFLQHLQQPHPSNG